jgi:shikimate kinase
MRILIGGVSCVGKTTVGARLADRLARQFYDLDAEVQLFFGTSIERLRNSHLSVNSFRRDVTKALQNVLSREESRNCVIALPPSGLMGPCGKVVKSTQDAFIIVLVDAPENILKRITFYDIDSREIYKILSDQEKRAYLREIAKDISYFKRSWKKANLVVDIAGCLDAKNAACRLLAVLPPAVVAASTV